MTDQGTTTRISLRNVYSSPPVAASGPTPGLPTTDHGQYGRPIVTEGQINLPTNTQNYTTLTVLPPVKYKMCGQDASVNGLYDTWVVSNAPDFTGSQYTGGLNTPLRNIFVCG
jgi:hypothetical protein